MTFKAFTPDLVPCYLVWTMNGNRVLEIGKLRLIARKYSLGVQNPFIYVTPFYWPVHWRHGSISESRLLSHLELRLPFKQRIALISHQIIGALAGESRFLRLPTRNGEVRHLVLSWATPKNLSNLKMKKDRFLGDISGLDENTLIVISLLQKWTQTEIETLLSYGYGCLESKRTILRPIVCLFSFFRYFFSGNLSPFYWMGLLTLDFMEGETSWRTLKKGLGKQINKLSTVFLAYEGHPHHQRLIFEFQTKRNIPCIGYNPCAPGNFPSDLLWTPTSPKLLYVHSPATHRILVTELNWPSVQVKTIPSLSLNPRHIPKNENNIFLPYYFDNAKLIESKLRQLIQKIHCRHLGFKVNIHPTQIFNPKHEALAGALSQLFSLDHTGTHSQLPIDIVIGYSSVIFELLEAGRHVYQITEDGARDGLNSEIWSELETNEFEPGIYEYRLKKFGSLIIYSRDKQNILPILIKTRPTQIPF